MWGEQFRDTTICESVAECYYLRPADKRGRLGSAMVVFTPEGIVIMGDVCPGRNGVVSAYGYGKKWFASELDKDYLASKFLPKVWVEDVAAQWLRETIDKETIDDMTGMDNPKTAAMRQKLGDLLAEFDDGPCFGPEGFHERLDAIMPGLEGSIGYDYEPRDVELLAAIQRGFRAAIAAKGVSDAD